MKRLALLALVALGWAVLRRQPTATAELFPNGLCICGPIGRLGTHLGNCPAQWDTAELLPREPFAEPWPEDFVWPEPYLGPCGTCGAPLGKPHQRGCFWDANPIRPFPPYPGNNTVDSGNDWADGIQGDAGLTMRLRGEA